MNRFFTLFALIYSVAVHSQDFSQTGTVIPRGTTTVFSISVSGLPPQIDSVFGLESLTLDIIHASVEDLHVTLRSPAGVEVELTGTRSCKGNNFTNTVLKNGQQTSVASAAAPYTGTFSPVGNLGRFNRGLAGNGTWLLVIEDRVQGSNPGVLTSWSLGFGFSPAKPVLLNSSNLPLVFMNTPGQVPLTESDLLVDLGIVYNGQLRNHITDQKNNYNGKAICFIRGSSSRMFEKNNLKIELKKNNGVEDTVAALLGLPGDADWILTACYADKTLLRNPLAHHIFQGMGHYSPRYRYVELILNGEYFGVYILTEQIKRGQDRLNIARLEPTSGQFPEITGGYIVQIDRVNSPGWYSAFPGVSANSAKFFYQYNYPRPEVITPDQKAYIKSVLDSFETVIHSPDFDHPQNGFRKFIDEATFIDYMIVQEVAKNVDAYKLSSYLYKDNVLDGGRLHAGPVWDFDLAWHNSNFGNAFNHDLWQYEHNNSSNPIPTWWRRFTEDPVFRARLHCRYVSLRNTLLSHEELFGYIEKTAEYLAEARERNFRQFPVIGAYIWPNPQVQAGATYESEVNDLKTWIVNRTAWLDENMSADCLELSGKDADMNGEILVYPNPFSDVVEVQGPFGTKGAKVGVSFYRITGECVLAPEHEGEGKIVCQTSGLAPGFYVVRVNTGKNSVLRKMVRK